MAKLPFIVEPRMKPVIEVLGTEVSGKIEIERKGYLTAAEKAFTQAQSSQDDVTQEVVKLCRKIGVDLKIDMQKAYKTLTDCMQAEGETKLHQTVSERYAEEMGEILAAMNAAAGRTTILNALCMLLYRVDPKIDAAVVMELHPDLLEALDELYRDEEMRSVDRLEGIGEVEEASGEQIDALEKK